MDTCRGSGAPRVFRGEHSRLGCFWRLLPAHISDWIIERQVTGFGGVDDAAVPDIGRIFSRAIPKPQTADANGSCGGR